MCQITEQAQRHELRVRDPYTHLAIWTEVQTDPLPGTCFEVWNNGRSPDARDARSSRA